MPTQWQRLTAKAVQEQGIACATRRPLAPVAPQAPAGEAAYAPAANHHAPATVWQ
ncbi:hypothetical protein APS_1765 [Acetobacter pasteurianus subsp. pasteurianus LMG 1262 = NBRC 106471]|uniref:hypothetical protein n=1 Tax=Acetobacter pasteurianus TaxID=438 RepID=UPI0002457405|nr:hypothetical protein [Acetobacter pasteurianus]GAB31163.1 hypothetical protein APS_1765 [Acetobacter pasteurianus subsp. pasteurianus LMG 1262 = NBRC 106471]CCT59922.1 hypothetical protein APA386B_1853 [Acetobacter pasteurianus 386B]